MESYDDIIRPFNIPSPRNKKCKLNNFSFCRCITGLYMMYVMILLFTLFGLTTSLFIIEKQFIIGVTPFVKGLQVPDFNMTLVVPTINQISNIVENVCKQPEFKELCN